MVRRLGALQIHVNENPCSEETKTTGGVDLSEDAA